MFTTVLLCLMIPTSWASLEKIPRESVTAITFERDVTTKCREGVGCPAESLCVGDGCKQLGGGFMRVPCVVTGTDGPNHPIWKCEAEQEVMWSLVSLKSVNITCEQWNTTTPDYIIRDSCYLRYETRGGSGDFFFEYGFWILVAIFSTIFVVAVLCNVCSHEPSNYQGHDDDRDNCSSLFLIIWLFSLFSSGGGYRPVGSPVSSV